MDGGRGYTPQQVGELTLDQVLMLLTDRKILANRNKPLSSSEAGYTLANKDGYVRARDVKGNPIMLRAGGKSKARQLIEAERARKAAEKAKEVEQPSRRELRRRKKEGG